MITAWGTTVVMLLVGGAPFISGPRSTRRERFCGHLDGLIFPVEDQQVVFNFVGFCLFDVIVLDVIILNVFVFEVIILDVIVFNVIYDIFDDIFCDVLYHIFCDVLCHVF